MELSIKTAQHFFLALALGIGPLSLIADTRLTGVGFYRVVMSVVGGCLALFLVIELVNAPDLSTLSVALPVLAIAAVVAQFKWHQDIRSGPMWLLYGLALACTALMGWLFMQQELISFLYFLSCALFLSSVTFTMILGHWYLVTPKLTERPLVLGIYCIWSLLAIKVAIGLGDYAGASEALFSPGTDRWFGWCILAMRATWGYLIVGGLSYFAWRLVRMRSLQSATGIFYVMTFFIFIGEIMAAFLFYHYRLKT